MLLKYLIIVIDIIIFVTCLELPSVLGESSILVGELESFVETCFSVTGSPKPLLKIIKEGMRYDNITTVFPNLRKRCIYFGPVQLSDAGNFTVTAENCFGKSNFTFHLQIVQSKLQYALTNIQLIESDKTHLLLLVS